MPDLIRLLPDSVANQIAAGEVIQRPASAVKEMLENAVDAGASNIKLIVKDAGRTLIQVTDNGSGMSVTDARMSFERHATSKIREANDLFAIRTLGFRGEALASIAAIAQVELKTRKQDEELGTYILIEGSKVKSQEPVSCPAGTSLQVKNLFYNVPARRNFLKSDVVEFRHVMEEFQRVAMVHPEIELSLFHNDKPVFQLSKANLRQRIVHIFGNSINEKLLPVEMKTEQILISGYIGKPETARKTRGEQYFFANARFIRYPYLHHAVEQAFDELIPDSAFPSYFLFIEVDPATIDVNIHPTKTEVKFQHEQLIYGSVRSAVKHALGMFSLAPTLDFNTEPGFDFPVPKGYEPKPPTITIDPDYNPFNRESRQFQKPSDGLNANRGQWEKIFEVVAPRGEIQQTSPTSTIFSRHEKNQPEPSDSGKIHDSFPGFKLLQVQNRFIVANVKSGLLIVDQQKAHERILFERINTMMESEQGLQQRSLFPQNIHLSPVDCEIIREIASDLINLGFEISELGGGTFIVNATPASLPVSETGSFIEGLLEDYKKDKSDLGTDRKTRLAKILARNMAVRAGKSLQPEEMQTIIDELFGCKVPEVAPDGSRILKILVSSEIEKILH